MKFQSLIGRLQTVKVVTKAFSIWYKFQSLIGRLQTNNMPADKIGDNEFQSLIGRLQTAISYVNIKKHTIISIPHR